MNRKATRANRKVIPLGKNFIVMPDNKYVNVYPWNYVLSILRYFILYVTL